MNLPKEKVKVTNRNPKTIVIYGPPKVGKTGALAQLEDNLIIDIEGGSQFVEALKVEANNFKELQEIGVEIVKNNNPYSIVTVDTVTKLEEWSEKEATRRYKKTPQGKSFSGNTVLELDYGAGYYWLRIVYKEWMQKLAKLAPTVIFVAHVKDKFLEKNGKEVSAKDLDLTGKIRNITASDADAIGYVYRDPEDSNKMRITFKHEENVMCGSRCEHLRGKDLVLTEADENGIIINNNWNQIFID